LLLLVILLFSSNLLLALLALEILSFLLLFGFVSVVSASSIEFALISLFCVFVIERVIALSGLILLVRFTGTDYVSSSSFLQS
jgi:hypothetical protein